MGLRQWGGNVQINRTAFTPQWRQLQESKHVSAKSCERICHDWHNLGYDSSCPFFWSLQHTTKLGTKGLIKITSLPQNTKIYERFWNNDCIKFTLCKTDNVYRIGVMDFLPGLHSLSRTTCDLTPSHHILHYFISYHPLDIKHSQTMFKC